MKKEENRKTVTRYGHEEALRILSKKHGERFLKYRKEFEKTIKEHTKSNMPLYIAIGINSDCNLRCKMCLRAYDTSINKIHQNMSLEKIDSLVEQCKEFNLPSVLIGAESECLLHPQIKEILKKIQKIDTVDYYVITNGLLLDEEKSIAIIESGVDRLEISVDAALPETYRKIRGGDLHILEDNINRFLEMKKAARLDVPIVRLSFCKMSENISEQDMFLHKWINKVDIIDFQEYIDMSRIVDGLEKIEPRSVYCQDPFQRMMIDYKGDIYCCCSFGYCEYYKIGNMDEMSLLDAWNSDIITGLRNSFLNNQVSQVCLNCQKNALT